MKLTIVLFILKLILSKSTNADYVQPSCAKKSRRFIATEGHALIGTVISTHNVILFQECHELCLQTPRCLSYNYEYQSTSSTHVCEINDATDKMCPGNLARKPGFKYYEEKFPDADGTNFLVTFPYKSVKNYIKFYLPRCASPLTAFTVCMWVKTTDQTEDSVAFSYSIPDEDNEISIYNFTSFKLYIVSDYRKMGLAVNDDRWHHICTTWENTAGSWSFYVNGTLWEEGDGFETGHVIENNGIFVLGQDQDSYGGGFEKYQSFVGQMYGVNMWDRVLTAEEILHMSGNCSYGVGNYVRWSDFVTGLHGDVRKTSPATCLP